MISALELFAMALKYLQDHLAQSLSHGISASDIRWVINVPAMSTQETKDFMREAAFKAGLTQNKASTQLLIVTEAEAASVYCFNIDEEGYLSGQKNPQSWETGTKYLLINAGDGTVHFTIHEVLSSGKLKEISTASGGTWAATKVDQNFVKLIEEVLGRHFIQDFQQRCQLQWQFFMLNFQKVKHYAKPDGMCKICIPLTWTMGVRYQELCGSSIENAISKAEKQGVNFNNGALVLNHEAVVSLYQPVIDSIVSHIDDILSESAMSGVSCLMLVGEFAQSAFLQKAIIDRYKSTVNVVVPQDAQYSVIQGAVLYGHTPDHIWD